MVAVICTDVIPNPSSLLIFLVLDHPGQIGKSSFPHYHLAPGSLHHHACAYYWILKDTESVHRRTCKDS